MSEFCCDGHCPSMKDSVMNDLSESERCKLRGLSVSINLKKGQNIFEQGRRSEGVFCIRNGKVKTSLESANGESVTVNLYSETGMVGHHSLITGNNLYTATCLTDSEVCFLPQSAINRYVYDYPKVQQRVMNILLEEFKQLNAIILNLRSKSVVQRLAEIIIKLQNTFGIDEKKCINVELTKEEISKMIGSSIESVFRTLSGFKEKAYIEFEGKKIKVLNEQKLRSLGKIFS